MASFHKSHIVWTLLIVTSLVLGGTGGLLVSHAMHKSKQTEIDNERHLVQEVILKAMKSIAVGDTLLDHTFERLDLTAAKLSELVTGTTLISIIDPDCSSCLDELATLSQYASEELMHDRIMLVSQSNPRLLSEFRDSSNIRNPILYDHRGRWIQHYRVMSFPFNMIIDSNLVVQKIIAGQLTADEALEFTRASTQPRGLK